MIIRDPGSGKELPLDTPTADSALGKAAYGTHVAGDEAAENDRQPKGDHNRRLALGMDVDDFALEAGVTAEELREYESTWPDHEFSLEVAARVGTALDRLEKNPPPTQKVSNGPVV